ncbi:MAG: hypothetical protein HY941_03330 [Gammaproteobacteria bacterium]|nr:hypothetical protein [Gammaproteobacteria bacterium]
MARSLRILGQSMAYALFAALLGYLSVAPAYSPIAANNAVVTLSFAHSGKRVAECRTRSAEELAALPPNMRNPLECSRERSPVTVRFAVDGEVRYERVLQPTGFSSDGTSYVYAKTPLPAGRHTVSLYLDDDSHHTGGVYEHNAVVELRPQQILVIDFNPDTGFILR